ncbi:TlpA disulfide reductase family protein [Mitsuaria sp. GD03876]|uniref:TlpA disulfide reductase family protein n=1 Tax=Mitsuaria sp. GD03876 TaxID=2975399 RepID=UPI00244B5F5E|nr:TlpA disulfide reductase family protein [Mitsuaria sp. GD03876]MDH0863300.1 redoxin family protein [Mitsuaria sp. GD03876]
MSEAVAIGPLVLPWAFVHLCVAVAAAGAVAALLARRRGQDAGPLLWRCLIVALVFARLGFLYQYKELYAAHPLSVLNLRDGGWSPEIGIVAMWMYATFRLRNAPALRLSATVPLALATTLVIAGQIQLALQPGSEPLPRLRFETLDGAPLDLAEPGGKPTLVNLWATWCGPCIREMPMLAQAQRDRPDVRFVFLNQGEDAGHVRKWLDAQRLSMTNVAVDERRQASAAFKQAGYPTTLLFDASGRLVARRTGELSEPALQAMLTRLR